MTDSVIIKMRLHNQRLAEIRFVHPTEVVQWFGAVQAQDYLAALWAIGLRTCSATEAVVEQAIAERTIVRTWPMRGTLHFVAAEDVRWLLNLLAPRVVKGNAHRYQREFGLDEPTISQCKKVLTKALQNNKQLTRPAIYAALEQAGIATTQQRGLHILSRLAQDGLICFGPRAGKQPTFVLLDEWLPSTRSLTREESLLEAARRYFTSHGPATLQDFTWWTGLTSADAKLALELVRPQLIEDSSAGLTYWFAPPKADPRMTAPAAHLLPVYDEYTVAYKDRGAILESSHAETAGNGIFSPVLVLNGQVAGTWKRTLKRETVNLSVTPFRQFNKTETQALAAAAKRYGEFQNAAVVMAE